MDPIIDTFTARYLGAPADEYLQAAGRPGRTGLDRHSGRRPSTGHRPAASHR
ncbi:hypothetical protein [Georgenia sp. SUBG003]|uniref:hypothetical protein n=1 Tax=Georgenia sp. SUBG003 TaxID=1497974 RepID=UPI003AB260E5